MTRHPGPKSATTAGANSLDETQVAALRQAEAERARLLGARDELVSGMRKNGWSWGRLAALTGTTRQALMRRPDPYGT